MKQERNAKCACGSGVKYKKCCLLVERENARRAEIERRERMKQRAEEARRKREQHLDYLRANPETPNMRGMDPVMMALALAMQTRRFRA
jgi:hypothetical protein